MVYLFLIDLLGNDVIHQLTKNSPQKLRIHLQRFSGEKGYAEYSHFAVGNEDSKYKLTLSGYIGTAGEQIYIIQTLPKYFKFRIKTTNC